MIATLTRLGVTVLTTVEIDENFTSMGLSNSAISFFADDIVRLQTSRSTDNCAQMLLVVKMRGSEHGIDMTEYSVTGKGVIVAARRFADIKASPAEFRGPWASVSGENIPELRQESAPTAPPKSKEGRHE
jgi:circadian clock protein KaiC